MISDRIHDPDPRNILLGDLTQLIIDMTTTGHKIILLMDANEDIDKPSSLIRAFQTKK